MTTYQHKEKLIQFLLSLDLIIEKDKPKEKD